MRETVEFYNRGGDFNGGNKDRRIRPLGLSNGQLNDLVNFLTALTDPRVAETAVVGHAHPDWGEEVVAFIVAGTGATPTAEALDRLCLENLARFKRPKRYEFVESLPKNNYGKIVKTELRDLLARKG